MQERQKPAIWQRRRRKGPCGNRVLIRNAKGGGRSQSCKNAFLASPIRLLSSEWNQYTYNISDYKGHTVAGICDIHGTIDCTKTHAVSPPDFWSFECPATVRIKMRYNVTTAEHDIHISLLPDFLRSRVEIEMSEESIGSPAGRARHAVWDWEETSLRKTNVEGGGRLGQSAARLVECEGYEGEHMKMPWILLDQTTFH